MAIRAVCRKAGISLVGNEQGGVGVFCDGNLPGKAHSAHDLIGGVLHGRGAHALHGEGREADHHADNGHHDQKLDKGEGGRFNHRVHREHGG